MLLQKIEVMHLFLLKVDLGSALICPAPIPQFVPNNWLQLGSCPAPIPQFVPNNWLQLGSCPAPISQFVPNNWLQLGSCPAPIPLFATNNWLQLGSCPAPIPLFATNNWLQLGICPAPISQFAPNNWLQLLGKSKLFLNTGLQYMRLVLSCIVCHRVSIVTIPLCWQVSGSVKNCHCTSVTCSDNNSELK